MSQSLVIKITEQCNFKCTFCSSTHIAEKSSDQLDITYIRRYLQRYPDTSSIIVNGGDPLMVAPRYYHELLTLIEAYPSLIVSLTTNLWPFYKHPEKWTPIFNHPQVSVMTSFQFGDKRLKGDLSPFSLDDFWNVSDVLLEHCGYRPDFIAVIDEDNAHTVIETVELAKTMGVTAKLNYLMASGPQVRYKSIVQGSEQRLYLLASMYEDYLTIYDAGLAAWEFSTQQMMKKLRGQATICPLSRECDTGIRTLQPSGQYYSCPAMADDDLYRLDFENEMAGGFETPLQKDPDLLSMKNDCLTCPLFSICNGCRKTIRDHKRLGLVETHCQKMKQLAPRLIEANALTGTLIPTPYINETSAQIIAIG